uniref:Uncharacterized protein n=1 Tax=uncultured prokaryote TaxID=198431 RepID=A0A0H5Q203_9ZZZZ|nr:hypothetical protein [uncultured prokaryote]
MATAPGVNVMSPPIGFGVATMHWAQAGGLTDLTVTCAYDASSGAAQDAADAIESYWTVGDSPCDPAFMTVGWTFIGTSVLHNESGLLTAAVSYDNIAGTAADINTPVPAYTPLVITKRTAGAGVQYRGRMFPPLTYEDAEGVLPTGALDGMLRGLIQDKYDNLFALWDGGGWKPHLLHNPPMVGMAPAPTHLASFQVQGAVGTQRRRKVR